MIATVRGRAAEMWWGTAMETPDPAAAAVFYSSLLGWSVVHQEPFRRKSLPANGVGLPGCTLPHVVLAKAP